MPGPAIIFKELHRLRQHIEELDERIASGPRSLRVQQAKLATAEETFKQAQEFLKQLAVQNRAKEAQIKSTEQQIKKFEKQLNDVTNTKEFDALKSETAQARASISKLEDEILEGITLLEEKTAALPTVEKATKQAREDFARFDQDHAAKVQRWTEEKARALEELKATEAQLDEDARMRYDRFVKAKGTDALSGVKNATCVACYTTITNQMLGDLRSEEFVICNSCGRMLYLAS
jgi:predicted  nucleic acid-binding Zn-ribbon protein